MTTNVFDWRGPSVFQTPTKTNREGKEVRSKSEAQNLRVAQGRGTKKKGLGIAIQNPFRK